MAFIHGKSTKVMFDEFDVSAFFSAANVGKTGQAVDVTMFTNGGNRSYIAGLEGGQMALTGAYDPTDLAADPQLSTALGTEGITTVCINDYTTIGQPAVMAKLENVTYQVRSSVSDALRTQFNGTADGGVRFGGVILHGLSAETTTGNYASVDNTASSAFGGVAHLHVSAFTGTSGTLKVQHSTDNSVWVDLITFTAVTAVGVQRSTVTGTVNRYVRGQISADTFTSMTFLMAFARNKQ